MKLHCPYCDEDLARRSPREVLSLDGKIVPEDFVSQPGDVSLCTNCANVSVYDEDMGLTKLTPEEWEDCPPEIQTRIRDLQRQIQDKRQEQGLKIHPLEN